MNIYDADEQQSQSESLHIPNEPKAAAKKVKPSIKYIVFKTGFISQRVPKHSHVDPEYMVRELTPADIVFDDMCYPPFLIQWKYRTD
jgi:hypothetical protein